MSNEPQVPPGRNARPPLLHAQPLCSRHALHILDQVNYREAYDL